MSPDGVVSRPAAAADDDPGSGRIGPTPEDDLAAAAWRALDLAIAASRAGERERARQYCAAAVFDAQPLLTTRPRLLSMALCALLSARAFSLLSRLAMAIGGHEVAVVERRAAAGSAEQPRLLEAGRHFTLRADTSWLDALGPDDLLLHRWSAALVARRRHEGVPAAAEPKAAEPLGAT